MQRYNHGLMRELRREQRNEKIELYLDIVFKTVMWGAVFGFFLCFWYRILN
jgi:hypothetical protein